MNRSPVTFLIWCHFPHFCHLFWQLRGNCVTLAWKDSLSRPFFPSRKRGMNLFCLVPWVQRGLQEMWYLLQSRSQVAPYPSLKPAGDAMCEPGTSIPRDAAEPLSWSGERSGRRCHYKTPTSCGSLLRQRFPQVTLGMSPSPRWWWDTSSPGGCCLVKRH